MSKKILTFLLLLLGWSTPLFPQFHIDKGEANDLYAQHCASCHGKNLEGGQSSSLLDDEWKYGTTDAQLRNIIREGIPETTMIPWKAVLTEDQIRAMVIYLRERARVTDRQALARRRQPKGGIFTSDLHNFRLEKVVQGEGILWGFDFLPDGSILANQRSGIMWRLPPRGEPVKIEGTPPVWHPGGESGMFDLRLHPHYEDNGWVYISFSDPGGVNEEAQEIGMTAVVRGRIQGNRWVDQEVIFRASPEEYTADQHIWGSRIIFKDGYLYFSVGARVDSVAPQDLTSAKGKVHRMHDDGRIPEDNPFVQTKGAIKSIWSWGHRNPQGLTVHPDTGEIWSTEHGPRGGDEVNIILKGQNYGWPLATYGMDYDGTMITDKTALEGTVQPLLYWVPSIGPGGIDFYEGDAFPHWKGNLLAGGMWSEGMHRLTIENGRITGDEIIFGDQGRVRNTVYGPDGHVYLSISVGDPRIGAIYKLLPVD